MVIKSILEQLEGSSHPVAKALHKGDHFKVLVMGFKKGMSLKDHAAHQPTKLAVLTGNVMYKEAERELKLEQYDEIDIPVNVIHSVEALDDSLCLLTQGI